jgi:L-fuculose-phosphate aldolase
MPENSRQQVKAEFKQAIVDTGRTIIREGLTVSTWGNISIRDPETGLIYISPSGMDYEEIRVEDVVVFPRNTARYSRIGVSI